MVNRQHTTGTTRRRTLKKYYIYNKFLIQSLKMNKHFHIYNKRYLSYVIVFLFQYSYSSRDLPLVIQQHKTRFFSVCIVFDVLLHIIIIESRLVQTSLNSM